MLGFILKPNMRYIYLWKRVIISTEHNILQVYLVVRWQWWTYHRWRRAALWSDRRRWRLRICSLVCWPPGWSAPTWTADRDRSTEERRGIWINDCVNELTLASEINTLGLQPYANCWLGLNILWASHTNNIHLK